MDDFRFLLFFETKRSTEIILTYSLNRRVLCVMVRVLDSGKERVICIKVSNKT